MAINPVDAAQAFNKAAQLEAARVWGKVDPSPEEQFCGPRQRSGREFGRGRQDG